MFTHESGIHIDGLLKNPSTYESFDPAELGRERRTVLGKHSGSQSVRMAYGSIGVALNDDGLTGRLLGRIRAHAMAAKRAPTPQDLQRFLAESRPAVPAAGNAS